MKKKICKFIAGVFLSFVSLVNPEIYALASTSYVEDPDQAIGTVNVDSCLNLRSGAGTDYQILDKLPDGTEVEIISKNGNWYKVMVSGQTGFVYADYIDNLWKGDGMVDISEEDHESGINEDVWFPVSSGNDDVGTNGSKLTPQGNLTLVDDIGSVNPADQQFITVVTKNGNYFYIIIDRNNKGDQNVHFLNQVDERDLLDLMNEEEAAEYLSGTATKEDVYIVPDETDAVSEVAIEEEPITQESNKAGKLSILPVLLVVVMFIAVGATLVLKKLKGKKQDKKSPKIDPDVDYDPDDDAYDLPEGDYEEENDSWLGKEDTEEETSVETAEDYEEDE